MAEVALTPACLQTGRQKGVATARKMRLPDDKRVGHGFPHGLSRREIGKCMAFRCRMVTNPNPSEPFREVCWSLSASEIGSHIGASMAARLAHKPRLNIGKPGIGRPLIAVHRN